MTAHNDALGIPIEPGHYFARATERAGQAVLDFGRVVATTTSSSGRPTISAVTCRGGHWPRLHKAGKPVTIERLDALILVVPGDLPREIFDLLGAGQ